MNCARFRTSRLGLCGFPLLFLLAVTAGPGRAASFSAELADTQGGQTRTGRFFFLDTSYRYEIVENGQPLVIMVDGKTGTMHVMVPAEKAFYMAGPDEVLARMSNPFGAYAYYASKKDVKAEGTEAIDSVPCTKQVVSGMGQVFAVAWVSKEFDFPLKVQTTLPERTLELRNIRRGPQDAALFTVPADYKQIALNTEPPPPEWAGQVAAAPVLTPPFEKTLKAGAIIRIRPQAGQEISLQAAHAGGETSAFTAVGFKNGRPLGDVSGNTMNLSPGQDCKMVFTQGQDAADDYVVRIRTGSVKIRAAFGGGAAPGSGAQAAAPTPEPPGEPGPEAQIAAAPQAVGVAERFEVAWNGPANKDDYITIARPEQPGGAHVSFAVVRDGNPLKIWAPSDPGAYEIRYILGRGANVLAKAPITINPAAAGVEAAGPVNAAAPFEAKWQGPAREGDYISVARPEQVPSAYVTQGPVRNGNPVKLRAPSDPGEYEVRYILGRGARLLAKTPLTVNPVTATLQPPATVKAGGEFEVSWKGPGYAEDFVTVARESQAPGAYVSYMSVRRGNPLKVRAPKEPGSYEVRYILGRGNRLLGKAPVTIEVP